MNQIIIIIIISVRACVRALEKAAGDSTPVTGAGD